MRDLVRRIVQRRNVVLPEAVLERGAYEHAARASESAPMKTHSLARRACITQAPIFVFGPLLVFVGVVSDGFRKKCFQDISIDVL